jgi:CHAT domain-containing protein
LSYHKIVNDYVWAVIYVQLKKQITMKQYLLLTLSLLYYFAANAQLYTLKDTLRADSLTIRLSSKQRLCECPDKWLQQYGEAYAIYKATLTDRHKKTAGALLNLTRSHYINGELKKALLLSKQNLEAVRSLVPPKDSMLFTYLLLYTDIKLNNGISPAELLPLVEELQDIVLKYDDWNGKVIKIDWLRQAKQWLPWHVPIKNLPDDIDKTFYDLHEGVYGKNNPKTIMALAAWGQSLIDKGDTSGQKKIEEAMHLAEAFKETAPKEYFDVFDVFTNLTTNEAVMGDKIRVAQNILLYINQQCGEKGACLDRDWQRISLIAYFQLTLMSNKNRTKRDYNMLWSLYVQFLETSNSNLYKMGIYKDLADVLQSKAEELKTVGDTVAFREYQHNALQYALTADSLISHNKGLIHHHRISEFMAKFYNTRKEPRKALPYLKKMEQTLIESDILMPNKALNLYELYSEYENAYTLLGQLDSAIYYVERNIDLFHNDPYIYNIFKDDIYSLYLGDFKVFALYLKTNQTAKAEQLWQKWTQPDGVLTQNPCLKAVFVSQVSEYFGVPQCFDFFKTHNINLADESLLTPCNTTRAATTVPLIIGGLLNKSGNKQAAVKILERTPQLYGVSYDSLNNIHADILTTLATNHFLLSGICDTLSNNMQLDKKTRQLYTEKALNNAEFAYRVVDVFRRDVHNAPWKRNVENPDYPLRYIIWNAVKYALALKDFNDVPDVRNTQIKKAFQYSEIARAKTLLESMLYREAIENKPASNDSLATLIYQDTLLQNRLIAKELDKISAVSKIDTERLKRLENEIVTLKFDLDLNAGKLKQKLDIKLNDNIVSIPQVQAALKPDEALIEYLWDKTALHTFVIKKDTFWTTTVDSIKDLDGLISRYLDLMQDRSNLGLTARLHKKADSLYQYLFLPLNTALLPQKLIIIPHRTIALLPFETLREGQQYLVEKYAIRYAYSATTLLKMQNLTITNKGFVGFAPFAAPSESTASTTRSDDFVPLPETKKELDNIKTVMGGTGYYYQEATKEKFMQEAVKYAYIHLPTHAESPDNNSARIAFFNQDKKIWDKTAALYGQEIYNMKFNADLITLSACETYGTKQNNDESEGIMGLARGFSQAGVRSIISTLWVVNSEKTAQLMIVFYQNLKKGRDKLDALRQVKLQMIQQNETAHPYYWAAPILIGDSGQQ